MKLFKYLALLLPSLCYGQFYNQTDVISTNAIALTNKTFDCTLNTCLNFSAGSNLFSTSTLNIPGTYTRSTSGQNSFASTTTLTGSENNAEYASMDFLMQPGAFTNSFASQLITVARFNDTVNNTSAVGAFGGITAQVNINGPTGNNTGSGGNYVSGTFVAQAVANDNGTSGAANAKGSLFGINPNVRLTTAATFWNQIVGDEIDLAVDASSSVNDKIGLQIVQGTNDATQGGRENVAISLNNHLGASGWQLGLGFGGYNGRWPFTSTATLIGCEAHGFSGSCGTTQTGIDFGNVVFTGNFLNSTGFSVNGSGLITGSAGETLSGGSFTLSSPTAITFGTSSSQATWTTTSPLFNIAAATLNDTTTGSGGVTSDVGYSIQSPTVTNTQGTSNTLTNLYTLYVAIPTCGAGWTACTNRFSIFTQGGILSQGGMTINGGIVNLNASSNNVTNINTGTSTSATNIGNTAGTGSAITLAAPVTLGLGTALSKATWANAGYGLVVAAATYDDSTTGSGTVTNDAAYGIAAPTVTNTEGTANTLTNLSTLFIAAPVCGGGWSACTNTYSINTPGKISVTGGAAISGAATSINASSNFNTTINTGTSTGTVTIGQNTASPSSMILAGPVSFQAGTAYSGASWTTISPVWNGSTMTLNDTTASGTVAKDVAYSIQAPTFTSTGGASTTITDAIGLYLAAPTCSGGVVCTNLDSLWSNGRATFNAALVAQAGFTTSGGTVNVNVSSSSNNTNINTGTNSGAIHIGDGSGNNTIGIGNGTGVVTGASPWTFSNATVKMTGITTGTNADTVCLKADGTLLIQAAACTISSLRFKEDVKDVQDSTIPEISSMRVASFRMKDGASNVDPNAASTQTGLIAENIAQVAPECAIYENDMKTPKSYRQECVIALLVKGEQELVEQNALLKKRISQLEAR